MAVWRRLGEYPQPRAYGDRDGWSAPRHAVAVPRASRPRPSSDGTAASAAATAATGTRAPATGVARARPGIRGLSRLPGPAGRVAAARPAGGAASRGGAAT